MTHLYFRSPHNYIGQEILNGLLSVGTQLTRPPALGGQLG